MYVESQEIERNIKIMEVLLPVWIMNGRTIHACNIFYARQAIESDVIFDHIQMLYNLKFECVLLHKIVNLYNLYMEFIKHVRTMYTYGMYKRCEY